MKVNAGQLSEVKVESSHLTLMLAVTIVTFTFLLSLFISNYHFSNHISPTCASVRVPPTSHADRLGMPFSPNLDCNGGL